MLSGQSRFLWVILTASLVACARYEAVPWKDIPGENASIAETGRRIVELLEEEVRENWKQLKLGIRAYRNKEKNSELHPIRIVLAAFPEARTGFRTGFSVRIEKAIRNAFESSSIFQVIDGGDGVRWQEAGISVSSVIPEVKDHGILGGLDKEISLDLERGKSLLTIRAELDRKLNDDHPLRGLWPDLKMRAYGEESSVFAASMLAADAAVYGGYALGPDRVRIWAALVLNRPVEKRFFRRGINDVFGLPEYRSSSRPYVGHVRGELPRTKIQDAWLAEWVPPNPRASPRNPIRWGKFILKVGLERIDESGIRHPLNGGEILDAETLVAGRLAVSKPRYVFGFAIDNHGQVEEVFASKKRKGKPAYVEPNTLINFTARLLPPGRTFRLYLLSSPVTFDTKAVIGSATMRLGIGQGEQRRVQSVYQNVVKGSPRGSWFIPPGQDRLILKGDWDQHLFWFHRIIR